MADFPPAIMAAIQNIIEQTYLLQVQGFSLQLDDEGNSFPEWPGLPSIITAVLERVDLTAIALPPASQPGFTVSELRSLLTTTERQAMDAALNEEANTDLLLKVKLAELGNTRIDPQSELFIELLGALVAFAVITPTKMGLLLEAFGLAPPEG